MHVVKFVTPLLVMMPLGVASAQFSGSPQQPLPVGTVLMLEKEPEQLPAGWKFCGFIRTEQSEKASDAHTTVKELVCIHKTEPGLP